MIITIRHCRECFYCSRGVRAFFTKYGLDYPGFIKNGIEEEALLALNDSMADRLVGAAHGKK